MLLNQIEELPEEMANCVNLELLRIAANQLTAIPQWLFELPKLSWVAFAGNPATHQVQSNTAIEAFHWDEFSVKELLGEGASGFISKATWKVKQEAVAIKVFKGAVTSDGLPEDEMKVAIAAGIHENLIQILGKVAGHPEQKSGLIMELISSSYINLGHPPSMETCTRDVFDAQAVYAGEELLKIAKSMASVCAQLHRKGINHGDLYAHNILVNKTADSLLGDFGAASFYAINSALAPNIERVEVRAFGCLVEDVFNLVPKEALHNELRIQWQQLIAACTLSKVKDRLSFSEIVAELNQF